MKTVSQNVIVLDKKIINFDVKEKLSDTVIFNKDKFKISLVKNASANQAR